MLNTPVTDAEACRAFAFSQGQGRDTSHADIVQKLTADTHPELWAAMNLGEEAPAQLWSQGDVSVLTERPTVAVTGSRAATRYGEEVAVDIVRGIAGTHTIVSGGAYGIDAAAIRATLAAGGVAAVFLAGGLGRLYPAGNANLIRRVAETGGVVLSEVEPDEAPTRWRFLRRQRLIAAASRAVVIVEAGARSGALTVAGWANTLGVPCGAVPGSIHSAASAGIHHLIRQGGAQLVTNAGDVLELLV